MQKANSKMIIKAVILCQLEVGRTDSKESHGFQQTLHTVLFEGKRI